MTDTKWHIDFADKRVLVTGGTRGIGQAAVEVFRDGGARVAVNGRTADSTAAGIESLGGDGLIAAPGDVTTVAGCEAAVSTAVEALGGLDVLVNSAGVGGGGPIEEVDEAKWDKSLDTNLKGTFFCIQAALPALRESGGNIVNVASDAGLMGFPRLIVYCASKGGVVVMTRAMALAFAPDVRVNCVCPGYVDTDMVRRDYIEQTEDPATVEQGLIDFAPLKRMAEPAEIGRAIAYLADSENRFVTGAALQIDGGGTAGR
jgi:NAD(P)-dependent dehydrogenase (short-subunit alcohol dehydrogenase family)